MGLKWNFKNIFHFIIFTISFFGYSQKTDNDNLKHKIYYEVRAFAFLTFNDDSLLENDDPFDFNNSTKLTGVDLSVNYYLINGISLGVGSGIETFTQPKFSYAPLYMRVALNGGSRKNSIHTELNCGGHFTDNSKFGWLFRFMFGYRFRVYKNLFANTSLIYTYQNLYKTFNNALRTSDYLHFKSVGLSVGFDIN
ncbi:hypothetical protein [Tamlana sp. I1]|uniref:hypothetical protein n=1 Tax=Tamlana sp. I1 TaxID=2762061 RepID=UPI00188EB32C|nr:hypothetical protein [Tamlana sp. I1]